MARGLPAGLLLLLAVGVISRGGVTPLAAAGLHGAAGVFGLVVALGRGAGAVSVSARTLALAWVGLATASLLWSHSPDASLDAIAGLAAAAVVFLLAALLPGSEARRRFSVGFSILGVGVAALAVGSVALGERADFPFGNPNHLAAWLLLPAGIGFAASTTREGHQRGNREDLLLWWGLLLVTGAGIAATRSVGAGLAVCAALGGYLVLARLGPRRGAMVALGVFAAAALALAVLPSLWPGLVPPEAAGSESSPGLRWAVWSTSFHAALESGFLGVGIGAFPEAFLVQRPEGVPYAARHAHSEPLQGLVELGIPFLLLASATGLVVARSVGSRLARGASRTAWGAATGLLALLAHSLVDFPLHVPAIALAGAALAGRLWPRGARSASPLATRWVLAGVSALCLVLAGTQAATLLAEHRAEMQIARGEFAAAVATAQQGLRLRPGRSALHGVLAQAAEHEWRFAGGGAARRSLALAASERAIASAPEDARLRVAHAGLQRRAGDRQGALAALDAAASLDPRSPVPHLARARLHVDEGDPRTAAGSLRAALERHPRAAVSGLRVLLRATGDVGLVTGAAPEGVSGDRIAGALLSEGGFLREAAEAYSRAYAAAPSEPELALRAARHFERVLDNAAARAVLRRALAHVPADPKLRVQLERLTARGAGDPLGAGSPGDASLGDAALPGTALGGAG